MSQNKVTTSNTSANELLSNLASLEEMHLTYEELLKEEALVAETLEWAIESRHSLEARLSQLVHLVPTLDFLKADGRKLKSTVSFTHDLAHDVSAKVRQLDLAKSRVSAVQKRVNDLLDLEGCAAGVGAALLQEDYEKAAVYIHRFLSMNRSLLKHSSSSLGKGESVETWFERLRGAETELYNIIVCNFNDAVKKDDSCSIQRFFKLFPLINRQEEGLEKFSAHLCSKVEERAVTNLNKAKKNLGPKDKRKYVIWTDTITLLFEDIAKTIEVQQPIIETYYKPGQISFVLSMVQKVCDQQVNQIISSMEEQRNIRYITKQCQDALHIASSVSTTQEQGLSSSTSFLDPRELDALLGELTLMNARSNLYLRFIKRRVKADLEASVLDEEEKNVKAEAFESLLCQSLLVCDMAVLIGNYTILEQFYLNESYLKATAMDSTESQGCTSSLVDDAFYIIKKSVRRAIASGSVDGVCAVLNYSVDLLERRLCPSFQRTLKDGFPVQGYLDLTQAYSALQSFQGTKSSTALTPDSDGLRKTFLVALNNAESSVRFVQALHDSLKDTIASAMVDLTSMDKNKIDSCLSDLSSTGKKFKSVTEFGLSQLQATAAKPKVKQWIDSFNAMSHDITEGELSSYEANDPFSQNLLVQLDQLVGSFVPLLTENNHKSFVELIVKELASQIEKAVMKSAFNRLGGLQFDRDIRSIIAYLTQSSEWGVRKPLSRVQQMATLINLESLSEVKEYSSSSIWMLTPADMRKVLRLRVDFKYDEIQKLNL